MRPTWLLVFCLAACSPYSFPKEVAAISTGVDQLSSGFTTGFAGLAADRTAKLQLVLTDRRVRVAITSSCLVPPPKSQQNAIPCELYQFGTAAPGLSNIELQRDATMAALTLLTDYAHALAAVTNAADRSAYDAAVAQLSGSVGALSKNADAIAPGASTVAPALVNIVGWLVGTALDQQRFDSLKAGITAASTPGANGVVPIDTVATTLGDGLLALSLARQAILIEEVNVLLNGLGPSLPDTAYRQRLGDAQSVVAVLDGLRQADPTAAAAGLSKAHAALVAAVRDPNRNYPNLLKALSDFGNQAAALQAALTATTTPPKATTKKGA